MASEHAAAPHPAPDPSPPSSAIPREAVEHQDQSIKVRKSQLFEPTEHTNGVVIKPFPTYLRATPPAPLAPGIKAALWAVGVLVGLLFLAAMFLGRGAAPRGRHAERPPAQPPALARVLSLERGRGG